MRAKSNEGLERTLALHEAAMTRIQQLALKVNTLTHQRDDLRYAAEKGRAHARAVVTRHGSKCSCTECGFLKALYAAVDACAEKKEG